MKFGNLSIRGKILLVLTVLIVILIAINSFSSAFQIKDAVTTSIKAQLSSMGKIASYAVIAGLSFEDPVEVSDAVSSFQEQEIVTYINVTNEAGSNMFTFRREGFPEITAQPERDVYTEIEGEIFQTIPVIDSDKEIGTISLGFSLATRDEIASSNLFINILLSLVIIAIFILSTMFISNKIALGNVDFAISKPNKGSLTASNFP